MAETAENATATQQVIGDITTELTWARSRVAELMAANRRLTEAEKANPFAADVCAQSREALTREARRILAEADFAVAAAADRLPEFSLHYRFDEPYTPIDLDDRSDKPGPGWVGSTPVPYIEPPVNQPPRPGEPGLVSNPGVPATPEPASAPVLEGSSAPLLTHPDSGSVGSPLAGPDGAIRARTGAGATPGVAGPRGAADGSGAPASPAGSAGVAARAGTAGGMMPVPPVIPPAGARTGPVGPGVVPGGRPARPGARRKKKDPRDPWYVPEGVPPVLEPGPPPRFDPGPGVIGIDR